MYEIKDIPQPPRGPTTAIKARSVRSLSSAGATMLGAPALCARAAFRGGAGLVKVACPADPAELLLRVLTVEPGATGVRLPMGDIDAAAWAMDQADPDARAVLAVGPGMGSENNPRGLVMRLLAGPRAVVLDADGLNALSASLRESGGAPALRCNAAIREDGSRNEAPARVLTPHPGEFRRLAEPLGITFDPTDPSQRPDAAAALAQVLGAVVLLKGQHTVISDGSRYALNTTGNPALATAGSGDVLTGVVAALLAQGMDAFDAACLGAHVHGRAADQWATRHGRAGLRAMELADGISDVIHTLHA